MTPAFLLAEVISTLPYLIDIESEGRCYRWQKQDIAMRATARKAKTSKWILIPDKAFTEHISVLNADILLTKRHLATPETSTFKVFTQLT